MNAMTDKLTLYVYYKVPLNQNALFLSAVKQVQQAIQLRYKKLTTKLQKRPNHDNFHQETWMEIYEGITSSQLDNVITDLQELINAQGLSYERRNEIFIDL
jgi:hypothetical protein